MDPTVFYIITTLAVSEVLCLWNSSDFKPKVLRNSDLRDLEDENVTAVPVPFKNKDDSSEVVLRFVKQFVQELPGKGSFVSSYYDDIFNSLHLLLSDENLQEQFVESVSSSDNPGRVLSKLRELKHHQKPMETKNLLPDKESRNERKVHFRTNAKNKNRAASIDEADETLSLLNITERVARHGFSGRDYTAVTADGYVLGLQRIWDSKVERKRTPVLLMHGLLLSASCWIDSGPKIGLAYLLARAGHDVWLGNARGNYYSRQHRSLNPKESEFWQFSADEIGKYDLPATIDKVLDETGVEKLNFIGFSQGAVIFSIMCSELPDYCKKTNIMIGVNPSGRHLHTSSFVFRLLCNFCEKYQKELLEARIFEVLPKNGLVQTFGNFFCRKANLTVQLCEFVKDAFDNRHPGSLTRNIIISLFANFPAGTSVKNLVRYSQLLRSKSIHKFDYGSWKNIQVYGSNEPPEYNLNATTVPVVVIYGRNDGIVDIRDVKWLVKKLPNVMEAFEVENPLWTHMDGVYSQYIPLLIYPKIEKYLNIYR